MQATEESVNVLVVCLDNIELIKYSIMTSLQQEQLL